MIETTEIQNAREEKFQGAPGKSMLVDLSSYGDNTDDAEFYQLPGSVGKPHDEEVGIKVDAKGLNIIVGSHNYKIVISGLEKGEHQIFSYDSDGNILSSAKCNKDGEFIVNEGTKNAARKDDAVKVTIPAGTFIVSVSGGSGTPAVGVLNPAPIEVEGTITEGTDKVLLP